jgi:hypothetical protein
MSRITVMNNTDGAATCWVYQCPGGGDSSIQSAIKVGGQIIPVHKYLYQLVNGPVTWPEVVLRRTCETAGCVAPHHRRRTKMGFRR